MLFPLSKLSFCAGIYERNFSVETGAAPPTQVSDKTPAIQPQNQVLSLRCEAYISANRP